MTDTTPADYIRIEIRTGDRTTVYELEPGNLGIPIEHEATITAVTDRRPSDDGLSWAETPIGYTADLCIRGQLKQAKRRVGEP